MSFSLRMKRYQKVSWGRCPKGHRWCDGKGYCEISRHNQLLDAIEEDLDAEGSDEDEG